MWIKKSYLTKLKQPKHEGVIYEFDQCEYKATDNDNPSRHKKSKHEGFRYEFRYECDQCEWKIHLTDHIKSKHEGMRYECDQC